MGNNNIIKMHFPDVPLNLADDINFDTGKVSTAIACNSHHILLMRFHIKPHQVHFKQQW